MLTSAEKDHILNHAYVPEHSVDLMANLSRGAPYLIDDFFCCRKEGWIMLIGYPLLLLRGSAPEKLQRAIKRIKKEFHPRRMSTIARDLSPHLNSQCRERESDCYYTLDTGKTDMSSAVRRNLKKAKKHLHVERSSSMGDAHQDLMKEFIARVSPPLRVKELLFKMPRLVERSRKSFLVGTAHFFPYCFKRALLRRMQNARTVIFEDPLDDDAMARVVDSGIDRENSKHLFHKLDRHTIDGITRELAFQCLNKNTLFFSQLCKIGVQNQVYEMVKDMKSWLAFFTIWSTYLKKRMEMLGGPRGLSSCQ